MARPQSITRQHNLAGYCTARGVYFKKHIDKSPYVYEGLHFPSKYQMELFKRAIDNEIEKVDLYSLPTKLACDFYEVVLKSKYDEVWKRWK